MLVLVFGLSAAFVLYVLFGFPLWLALLARRRKRPVHKRPETRAVFILLPVHNSGIRPVNPPVRFRPAADTWTARPTSHIR